MLLLRPIPVPLYLIFLASTLPACSSEGHSSGASADGRTLDAADRAPGEVAGDGAVTEEDGGGADGGGAGGGDAGGGDTHGGGAHGGGAHGGGAHGGVGCGVATHCPEPANPCLFAVCDPAFGCRLEAREDGTKCDDGDHCTTSESCSAGACVAPGEKDCDDTNACTTDKCDPVTGDCLHQPRLDGVHCDDGEPCTAAPDTCQHGKCAGGSNQCQCSDDADCGKFEDGNPCNGTLQCVKQGVGGSCKFDPATVVNCPTDQDTPCRKSQCRTADGSCRLAPVPGTVGCSDGDPCTAADHCKKGECKGSYYCECSKDADCAKQEDGDLCNGTLVCEAGSHKCVLDQATVVTCSGKSIAPCTLDACKPATGKCEPTPMLDGNACEDGSKCTGPDTCKGGKCVPGVKLCECARDADCPDNDNLCDGVPICDVGGKCALKPGSVVTCAELDGNACTLPACATATGACKEIPAEDGAPCSDGDACTAGERCSATACALGKPVTDCDDLDPCTADSCSPGTGACEHQATPGCKQPAPIPRGVTGMYDWLAARVYRVAYKAESKVATSAAHGTSRAWFSPPLYGSMAAGAAVHPRGSAAVKELFTDGGKLLRGWAVHVKLADPATSTTWYSYAAVAPSEAITPATAVKPTIDAIGASDCAVCHKNGKDYILSSWPLN